MQSYGPPALLRNRCTYACGAREGSRQLEDDEEYPGTHTLAWIRCETGEARGVEHAILFGWRSRRIRLLQRGPIGP
jgi:hypothetical protein